MIGTPVLDRGKWKVWRGICATLFAAALAANSVWAQSPANPPPGASPPAAQLGAPTERPPASAALIDPNIVQAGCASCGGGMKYGDGGGENPLGCKGCSGSGCDGPRCVPGRTECCEPCDSCSMFGRFMCGIKGVFCCPDPCYEPCYIPTGNAAFFVDSAKPVSQTRFRWDSALGGNSPDRAEMFFAQFNNKGPTHTTALDHVNYDELSLVTEFAVDRFSVFVENPYRLVHDLHAGFADMAIGVKSLMIDSEILLGAFQFKTYIPIGAVNEGLGTGHVTLEPALLFTLKVMHDTYIQGELAEWIPIAGTPGFSGSALKYDFSINHTLFKPSKDLQLVGMVEFGGISFQAGQYTNALAANGVAPVPATSNANSSSYFSVGPGFRLFICQKFDVGVGMEFGCTTFNQAQEIYRTEIRWRF